MYLGLQGQIAQAWGNHLLASRLLMRAENQAVLAADTDYAARCATLASRLAAPQRGRPLQAPLTSSASDPSTEPHDPVASELTAQVENARQLELAGDLEGARDEAAAVVHAFDQRATPGDPCAIDARRILSSTLARLGEYPAALDAANVNFQLLRDQDDPDERRVTLTAASLAMLSAECGDIEGAKRHLAWAQARADTDHASDDHIHRRLSQAARLLDDAQRRQAP
jgi:hypothetical protein